MSKSTNKKQIVSICSNTAETRGLGHAWLGKGLDGSNLSNIDSCEMNLSGFGYSQDMTPHPMGGGFSIQGKTATEIMMGTERAYGSSQLGDMEQAQQQSGHPDVMSYYNSMKQLPRDNGVMQGAKEVMSWLKMFDASKGGMYYAEKDEFFVGEWSIQTPELYHRHKELGVYFTMDGMHFTNKHDYDLITHKELGTYKTYIMWDAANGECGLCEEHMPGEIMMMHRFYQLP